MPYFEHDGVHLFYLVEGYGQVILLIHSFACDMHDWSYQIPMLVTRGFTTITLDTRGHGRSTLPDNQDYSLDSLAGDAIALLNHLGVDHAIVVGHNSGAVVASVLSAKYPTFIRGLVLINPMYYSVERERVNLVEGLQTSDASERTASLFPRVLYTSDTPPHLMAWHMRRARSTPDEAISQSLVHLFRPGKLGLWENMQALGKDRTGPRLVICTSEAHVEKEKSLGLAEFDRIEVVASSAWPHQQASDQVNTYLAEWFDTCALHG